MKTAARLGLIVALILLTLVAPAALVTQVQDQAHDVYLNTDPVMLAVAGALIALAYAAYLAAWRVLR